jgi:hypothetical protein
MTIDTTVTLGNLLTIGALIVGAISAWFFLRGDVTAAKSGMADLRGRYADLFASYEVLSRRVEEVRAKSAHELAEYKLTVAHDYATNGAIKEVEERVVEAINRLGDRFDMYFAPRSQGGGPRRRGGSSS